MTDTRTCPRCGREKPVDEFAIDRSKASGRKSACKACDRAKAAGYYVGHREERAAYYDEHRDEVLPRTRERVADVRAAAVAVYGYRCEWCGSTGELELDHVNGDGGEHRAVECSRSYYARIARSGERLPDRELRLLCRPCHRGPGWKERLAAHADA